MEAYYTKFKSKLRKKIVEKGRRKLAKDELFTVLYAPADTSLVGMQKVDETDFELVDHSTRCGALYVRLSFLNTVSYFKEIIHPIHAFDSTNKKVNNLR